MDQKIQKKMDTEIMVMVQNKEWLKTARIAMGENTTARTIIVFRVRLTLQPAFSRRKDM